MRRLVLVIQKGECSRSVAPKWLNSRALRVLGPQVGFVDFSPDVLVPFFTRKPVHFQPQLARNIRRLRWSRGLANVQGESIKGETDEGCSEEHAKGTDDLRSCASDVVAFAPGKSFGCKSFAA